MSELEIFWLTTGALIIVFTFLFGTMWLTIFLPKMKFLCRWFGHKIGGGYYKQEGGEYFDIKDGEIDGIDRVHCRLYTTCERCGIQYQVGRCHLPIVEDYVADLIKKSRLEKR